MSGEAIPTYSHHGLLRAQVPVISVREVLILCKVLVAVHHSARETLAALGGWDHMFSLVSQVYLDKSGFGSWP